MITEEKKQWWLSVRDNGKFNNRMKRNGDILYGVITPFKFSKTHRKIKDDRYQKKPNVGLRKSNNRNYDRLSRFLEINGLKKTGRGHFKNFSQTAKGKIAVLQLGKKVNRHRVREYGRRYKLILLPRYDLHYRKYGPLGG